MKISAHTLLWNAAAAWLILAVPARLPAQTSDAASAPYTATMTFDVASVHENKNLDPTAGIRVSGQFVPRTATFHASNWTIDNLIGYAYRANTPQVIGLPKWPFPTMFVIEAKGSSEADARIAALTQEQQFEEQRHMLQTLLEDRFKLKTHWETKEGDIYHLVVGKGGPKFGGEGSMPPSADELKSFGDHPIPPLYQKSDGQGFDFLAHGCSMSQLVETLTSQFGRPVDDKTGLTGKYDFVLKYKGRWDSDRRPDDLDPTLPMDQALQQELGLKVEAAKGPLKILVIDHIEKPSEN